jgi:hypothetical protein
MPVRQWLGIRHVEGRSNPMLRHGIHERLRIDESSTRRIHQQGAWPHEGKEFRIREMLRVRRQGQKDDDDIRLREQFRQVGRIAHAGTSVACHALNRHPKRRETRFHGVSDRAISDDENPGAFEIIHIGFRGGMGPPRQVLIEDEGWQPPIGREDRHHGPVSDRCIVHTGRVAKGRTFWDVTDEVIDPGRHRLHDAHAVQALEDIAESLAIKARYDEVAWTKWSRSRISPRQDVNLHAGWQEGAGQVRGVRWNPDVGGYEEILSGDLMRLWATESPSRRRCLAPAR